MHNTHQVPHEDRVSGVTVETRAFAQRKHTREQNQQWANRCTQPGAYRQHTAGTHDNITSHTIAIN